ncbi:Hypothetical pheromone [Malassezia sympodialis ATCC 42132]|uniref:Pheromone n=1 Tax=Malassezia sympodialis TaxID=76777 RepID=L7S6C8_MALSM|nr:putative pheromone [Malassezia sympodialis ATCC 42132]AGC13096.1 pheromone [Malassezia sympodialis]CCU99954.1 Hypothetical pheromone [Malassezia sympodialis ATCC 42132]|eukprot:XP_018741174.1 Hypothetical pheromone [Malassezia sympodialis ATCC 42132]
MNPAHFSGLNSTEPTEKKPVTNCNNEEPEKPISNEYPQGPPAWGVSCTIA